MCECNKVDQNLTPPEGHFYMLFIQGGGAPNVKHMSLGCAQVEAERLVKLYGHKAYVLRTHSACEPVRNVKWWSL